MGTIHRKIVLFSTALLVLGGSCCMAFAADNLSIGAGSDGSSKAVALAIAMFETVI